MGQRSFFRDITGVLGSNVAGILCSFLLGIVISRALGPHGRGVFAAILVVPGIVGTFTKLGTRQSAIFHIGKKRYEEAEILSGLVVLYLLSVVLGIVFCILGYVLLKNPDFTLPMVVLALMTLPASLVLNFSGGVLLGREEFRKANQLSWLPESLNLILAMVFLVIFKWDVTGALLAYLAASFTVAVYALTMVGKQVKIRYSINYKVIKDIFLLGITYAFALFIMQMNYRVDILLMQKLSTSTEIGFYSQGVTVAEQLWLLPMAVGVVVMSRSANAAKGTRITGEVTRLMRISFLLGILASVAIYFLAPVLIPLIYGHRFIPAVRIVQAILPGIMFFIIARILSSHVGGIGKPYLGAYIFIPSLLLNIILNYCWIPRYGGMGAAMATNVSYILGTLGVVFQYALVMKVPVKEIVCYRKSDFNFILKFRDGFGKPPKKTYLQDQTPKDP